VGECTFATWVPLVLENSTPGLVAWSRLKRMCSTLVWTLADLPRPVSDIRDDHDCIHLSLGRPCVPHLCHSHWHHASFLYAVSTLPHYRRRVCMRSCTTGVYVQVPCGHRLLLQDTTVVEACGHLATLASTVSRSFTKSRTRRHGHIPLQGSQPTCQLSLDGVIGSTGVRWPWPLR
jgi:hypothetical protein